MLTLPLCLWISWISLILSNFIMWLLSNFWGICLVCWLNVCDSLLVCFYLFIYGDFFWVRLSFCLSSRDLSRPPPTHHPPSFKASLLFGSQSWSSPPPLMMQKWFSVRLRAADWCCSGCEAAGLPPFSHSFLHHINQSCSKSQTSSAPVQG